MKHFFIGFGFFLLGLIAKSQEPGVTWEGGGGLSIDQLGHVYIFEQESIEKHAMEGSLIARFSNKNLGEVAFIDASNPMKVLVYYKDLGYILFLDSKLSERNDPINLLEVGYDQTTLACMSYNNGFWIFDRLQFQITRLDEQLNVVQQSSNILQMTGDAIDPTAMMEYQEVVYLNDPEIGLLQFDMFGGYMKTLPIKGIESFQVNNQFIFFIKNERLYRFNTLDLTEVEIAFDAKGVSEFMLHHDKLVVLRNHRIEVYEKFSELQP